MLASGMVLLMLLFSLHVPLLQKLFGVQVLNLYQWLFALLVAVIGSCVGTIAKIVAFKGKSR